MKCRVVINRQGKVVSTSLGLSTRCGPELGAGLKAVEIDMPTSVKKLPAAEVLAQARDRVRLKPAKRR